MAICFILLVLVIIVVMFVALYCCYVNIYNKRHQHEEKNVWLEAFQLELLQSQLEIQERILQNISQNP